MKIKVCGITSVEQLQALQQLGVDYAGLIFYEKSARFAGEKLKDVQSQIKVIAIKKVGVFVNATIDDVKRKIKDFGLAAVQLHGDEDANFCKALMPFAKVIKVFRISDGQNINELTEPFKNSCDYYLFDTDTKMYGGSGRQFDWQIVEHVALDKPFFLSGGIGTDDVEKLKMFKNPFVYAADVNSRFEREPGIKDLELVHQFVNNIKQR